jgi:hypothetical protein
VDQETLVITAQIDENVLARIWRNADCLPGKERRQ